MTAPTPREVLTRFGLDSFKPGQEAVIASLLAGRSALAVFPTGGGKSLCYQLPSQILAGLTLVVSPLIALMKDQVDALAARGIAAARLDSSIPYDQVLQVYDRLAGGSLKLLYVAPERLANERFLERLARLPIALLAIDEAHCISEWGHNFRPEYLKLARLARELRVGRVLALTATATPAVAADVRNAFGIAPEDHVQTGFHRANLELRVTPLTVAERLAVLIERLRGQGPGAAAGATIVYVTLQRTAEEVAVALVRSGLVARAYHAGMKDEDRAAVQESFMTGTCRVVVATIAFGMGIDKADIRAIYHYNLPKTIENYVQEIGRAGRDGQPSVCEMLAAADDTTALANFTYGDTPTEAALRTLVRALLGAGARFDVSHHDLSVEHDIRPLVVSTVLTYLELDGVLRSRSPFYSGYRLQFLRPEADILAGFDARRADFLRRLFATARKGRIWHALDTAESASALGEDRQRIVRAIGYLEERGDVIATAAGLRHGYEVLRQADGGELALSLLQRFAEREARDIERLASIVALAEHPGCLTRRLLGYFGEELVRDCGNCTSCRAPGDRRLPRSTPAALGAEAQAIAGEMIAADHPALAHPRQLARFLTGLTSPASARAGLARHHRFGCFAEVPFAEVLRLSEAVIGSQRRRSRTDVPGPP